MTANLPPSPLCPNCFAPSKRHPPCRRCGYGEPPTRNALPPGSLLAGRWLIGRVLGKPGGFGITYKALETASGEIVAVKELFPQQAAERADDRSTVQPREHDLFGYCLTRFKDEADRLLTLRGMPHVVAVRELVAENATAYIVMDYYEGITLGEQIAAAGGRLAQADVRRLGIQLGRALAGIHAQRLLHRDIKPANVYICRDGTPILLDFGSARFAIGERTQTLSVLVSAGFAPFEQYQTHGRQGPWSDLYALCATLYFALSGEPLPQAPDRFNADHLPPLQTLEPDIDPDLAEAIHAGLAVDADARPQRMDDWLALLAPPPEPVATAPGAEDAPQSEPPPSLSPTAPTGPAHRLLAETVTAVAALSAVTLLIIATLGLGIALLALLAWLALTGALYLTLGRGHGRSFAALAIPGWNLVVLLRGGSAKVSNPPDPPPPSPAPEPQPFSELSVDLPDDEPQPPIQAVFDSGRFSGSALPIDRGRLVIGRDHDVQLRLDTPEVSRRHLALTLEDAPPAILVEDLRSRNGSFVSVARNDGRWSDWRPLHGELRIAIGERRRWRIRLGEDGDRFHFE